MNRSHADVARFDVIDDDLTKHSGRLEILSEKEVGRYPIYTRQQDISHDTKNTRRLADTSPTGRAAHHLYLFECLPPGEQEMVVVIIIIIVIFMGVFMCWLWEHAATVHKRVEDRYHRSRISDSYAPLKLK